MADMLRIALSGMVANQGAMSTTGQNIANVGTDGYNRQRVDLVSSPPQYQNSAFFGTGVELLTVERIVNEFVVGQMRADSSIFNSADTMRFYAEQLDGLLGNASVGMSAGMDSFFGALQAAADDPSSVAARQVVLSEARAIADQFRTLYERFDQLSGTVNAQLGAMATDVSTLTASIADLNRRIDIAYGSGGIEDQPNDLLDQRDRALQELSALVDISTVQDGNAVNVFLGSRQPLVIGKIGYEMRTVPGSFDPARTELAVMVGNDERRLRTDSLGGKIGGMLEFRGMVLDPAYNQLGRVAIGFAMELNEQHALGMDLEGDLGGLLFSDPNAGIAPLLRARAAGDNDPLSTGQISVTIDDSASLTTSAYRLDILAGGAWRLYRNDDGTAVADGAVLTDPLVAVDGFTLNLNLPGGSFADGDSFLIEPTRRGAVDLQAVVSRAEDLALAQPARANAVSGNLGSGRVAVGQVFDTATPLFTNVPGALAPPLLVRFTSATTFDVLDNSDPANPVALVPPLTGLAYSPGVTNTLFSSDPLAADYFGFQLSLSGDPQPGDSFSVAYNTGGVSDNRNVLALARLQIADTLEGGTATFQDAFGKLLSFVGTETRRSRVETLSAEAVMTQTKAARDQYSGVNLDEEAANLIRFEQAYKALAQVIAAARAMIDSLLDSTR